jgi:hypothetical protein
MADENNSSWILEYVQKLMEEVKVVPKEEREKVGFHQAMATKHQTFFSRYPHLLTMVCDDGENFDINRLREMLGQVDEIKSGNKDLNEANTEMGQKYFDKYVSPHIDWEKEKEAKKKNKKKNFNKYNTMK